MKRKMLGVALAAPFVIAACAKSPDSIQASYVSEVTYQSWSCRQLSEESARLSSALATASTQQERARGNDVVGVILIGLPVSSLSGDNIAPEIARLKGEQEAVRRAMITKSCAQT
jgi:starvation-inducible outer membrane lipoprotein